jgi:hypothetical protein
MIARHESTTEPTASKDIWAKLAAPLPPSAIQWRQDGKPLTRDGKHFARFVAYVEANTVRERLDSVVPGEWDLSLEMLPPLAGVDGEAACSFKAKLQILGVVREDVGTGRDYKSASTDAFKRAAVRFGIAHELYAYEQNWVQVDGDSKYAKPLEDPTAAYARRHGAPAAGAARGAPQVAPAGVASPRDEAEYGSENRLAAAPAPAAAASPAGDRDDVPPCPKCEGQMWDNRASKRNPKAPDFKCRDRTCDGVVWPPKGDARGKRSGPAAREEITLDSGPLTGSGGDDDLPF